MWDQKTVWILSLVSWWEKRKLKVNLPILFAYTCSMFSCWCNWNQFYVMGYIFGARAFPTSLYPTPILGAQSSFSLITLFWSRRYGTVKVKYCLESTTIRSPKDNQDFSQVLCLLNFLYLFEKYLYILKAFYSK